MMKRFLALALAVLAGGSSAVMASGCFHDAINVVNKAGVISQGANVRNVACMYGSDVIATLGKGTKVRIIGQTARTEIVMPDGKVGRVGNNFVYESSDWSNVPAYPAGHDANDYCDTTNLLRCPNPSPQGVAPTWYYKTSPSYDNTTPTVDSTTSNPPAPTNVGLSDAYKTKLDAMVANLMAKVNARYDSPTHKIIFLENVVVVLDSIKQKYSSIEIFVNYIKSKLEEQMSMLELEKLLNID